MQDTGAIGELIRKNASDSIDFILKHLDHTKFEEYGIANARENLIWLLVRDIKKRDVSGTENIHKTIQSSPYYIHAQILSSPGSATEYGYKAEVKRRMPQYISSPYAPLKLGKFPWKIKFEIKQRHPRPGLQKKRKVEDKIAQENERVLIERVSDLETKLAEIEVGIAQLMLNKNSDLSNVVHELQVIVKQHKHDVNGEAYLKEEIKFSNPFDKPF